MPITRLSLPEAATNTQVQALFETVRQVSIATSVSVISEGYCRVM